MAALLLRASQHQPQLGPFADLLSEAQRSGAQMPPELLQGLSDVKARVEAAAKEAAAAEAAVHAVQQVRHERSAQMGAAMYPHTT